MSRESRFIETETYVYENVNPKNRITGDCEYRAIANALNQDYNQTVMEMAEMQCKTGFVANDNKGEKKYLESKGWIKMPQPKKPDGSKMTGKEFCKQFKGTCIAHIVPHHVVCIKDGKIHDTWNCENKYVGNYWIKG